MNEQQPALIPYLGTWLMPKPPQDPSIQARGMQTWQGIVTAIGSVLVGIGGANFGGGNDQDAQIAQLQAQLQKQEEAQAAQKKLVIILIALLFGIPLIGAGIYFATR